MSVQENVNEIMQKNKCMQCSESVIWPLPAYMETCNVKQFSYLYFQHKSSARKTWFTNLENDDNNNNNKIRLLENIVQLLIRRNK